MAILRSCSQQCEEYKPPSGQIFTIYKPLSRVISEDPHRGARRVKFVAPFHGDENRGLGKVVTQLAGGPVQMTGGGLGNLVSDT